ncbi:MAG: DUF5658 family protein [Methanofastidiosum sp.]
MNTIRIQIKLFLLGVMNLVDWALTEWGIRKGLYIEGNKLMLWLMEINLFRVYKLGLVSLLLLFVWFMVRYKKVGIGIVRIINVVVIVYIGLMIYHAHLYSIVS